MIVSSLINNIISRIQKIKTLEEKITLLKKEAANDLRKKIKQKERELLKLGQEYIQTFQEDFNFEVRLKKNNIKPTSGSSSKAKSGISPGLSEYQKDSSMQ